MTTLIKGDKVRIHNHPLHMNLAGEEGIFLKMAPCDRAIIKWKNIDITVSIGQTISLDCLRKI